MKNIAMAAGVTVVGINWAALALLPTSAHADTHAHKRIGKTWTCHPVTQGFQCD